MRDEARANQKLENLRIEGNVTKSSFLIKDLNLTSAFMKGG